MNRTQCHRNSPPPYHPAQTGDLRSDGRDHYGSTTQTNDIERQPLLNKSFRGFKASGFNWPTISFLVFVFLAGAYMDVAYNEQKYNLMARRWLAEERNHSRQRSIWSEERNIYEINKKVWLKEDQDHQIAMEKWANEKAAEARKRDAIVWMPLKPAPNCLQYNTREYTSMLTNVPLSYDAREECATKAGDLHGKKVKPLYCLEGQCGKVIGHWIASDHEPSCRTVWSGAKDKGCQDGVRHYHTELENMLSWDNWKDMCQTTPGIEIKGYNYLSPTKCETWDNKVWGVWFVEDPTCGHRLSVNDQDVVTE